MAWLFERQLARERLARLRARRREAIGRGNRASVTRSTRQLRSTIAAERDAVAALPAVEEYERPRTRADCLPGGCNEARPCPWVSCKYSLYLDVTEIGSLKFNYPDLGPEGMTESCALDVADRGGMSLDDVGELLRLVRERVRQVEFHALIKIKAISPSPEEIGAALARKPGQ